MPTLFVESLANYSPNPIVRGGAPGSGGRHPLQGLCSKDRIPLGALLT